jgi:hypothetical protein
MIAPSRSLLLKQYRVCRLFREREDGSERLTRDNALRQLADDIRALPRTRNATA